LFVPVLLEPVLFEPVLLEPVVFAPVLFVPVAAPCIGEISVQSALPVVDIVPI